MWRRAKVVVPVTEEPRLPPLVGFVSAVVIPPGGVNGVRGVVTEVRWENGLPPPDLFELLWAGPWHRQDGHPRGAEAPPAR
jgi:hypothetical protein